MEAWQFRAAERGVNEDRGNATRSYKREEVQGNHLLPSKHTLDSRPS